MFINTEKAALCCLPKVTPIKIPYFGIQSLKDTRHLKGISPKHKIHAEFP